MTDSNLTEIIAIVDRSGSMEKIVEDAIGGFNTFLKKQQEDKSGKCLLTYAHFDNEYEVVHDGIDIVDMEPLNRSTYYPRGSTALLDAIGRTIKTVGERLSKTPEEKRPGNVVVVILTDGQENASSEFTYQKIRELIEHQTEKYDWGFVYLAQNVDAFATGSMMGLDFSKGGHYLGDVKTGGGGLRAAYSVASDAVSGRRMKSASRGIGGQSVVMDWSSEEKEQYTEGLAADHVEVDEIADITSDSSQ